MTLLYKQAIKESSRDIILFIPHFLVRHSEATAEAGFLKYLRWLKPGIKYCVDPLPRTGTTGFSLLPASATHNNFIYTPL
jgi:hypothetical protein